MIGKYGGLLARGRVRRSARKNTFLSLGFSGGSELGVQVLYSKVGKPPRC